MFYVGVCFEGSFLMGAFVAVFVFLGALHGENTCWLSASSFLGEVGFGIKERYCGVFFFWTFWSSANTFVSLSPHFF